MKLFGKYNAWFCAVFDAGILRLFVGPVSVDLYRWGCKVYIDRTGAWKEA